MRVWISTWNTTKTYIGAGRGWEESGMNNKGMATKCVLWPAAKAEVLIYLNNSPLKKFPRERYNLEIMSWGLFLDGMDSQFWSKWFGWQECYLVDQCTPRSCFGSWSTTGDDCWLLIAESLLGKCSQLNNAASPKLTPSLWVCSAFSDWSKHGEEYPAPFVSIWDTYDGLFQLPSPLWNCLRLLSQYCSSASPLLPQRS